MNLIAGATGLVGSEICRLLGASGKPARALVRGTSDPEKVAGLRSGGAEIAVGDLKTRESLDTACRGVDTVISTASSTLSRQEGDSIETVDRQGQLNLVDAADAAGVRHFVLVSFPGTSFDFPLQSAKRAVEQRLRESRMSYTFLQPTFFTEVWLGPALGFDVAGGKAQIYGAGHNPISWISFLDVARFAAASIDNPRVVNQTIPLGGPETLSPLDAVRIAEQTTGKTFVVQHVPEDALRQQFAAATDSLQQSFAALMLYYAGGDVIDMTEPLRLLPLDHLKSVGEHLEAAAQQVGHAV